MASNSQSKNVFSRVVITGMGAVTPLALNMDDTWKGLLEGRSGINTIQKFDTSELRCKYAGEIKNFDPTNYMDRKEARRLDLYIQYAMAAAKEAMADAKLDMANEDPSRVGVIFGSAMGGMQAVEEVAATVRDKGLRRVSAFFGAHLH